ncbi:acetolactate synthase large subunit [Winkia sp. C62]|uniref:Acetolactate synthase n=2 Tax=Nanchangia anserum TaxID=2692125 RepID=A0A8I0G7R8_9ACTO|nr:acetolactate synthase large subunit [Nanchangia anserum]
MRSRVRRPPESQGPFFMPRAASDCHPDDYKKGSIMAKMSPKPVPRPPGAPHTERMTGAQAIVKTLEALGVNEVFGLPGGAILPTYDPIYSANLRHILVRHEQGAGHAAEGYAIASGRVGCAIVTSGPAATNMLTALADANLDSVPIVVITGQVGASAIGTDAFQESDIVGASMPLTKHNFLVKDAAEIPSTIAAAFHVAATGRPGPVLVDITKNAQVDELEFSWPPTLDLPGYRPVTKPHKKSIRQAAKVLASAQRPVLYVGGGVIRADAHEELAELAEISGAPVVTTLMGLGAFPADHPNNFGMPGMHGTVAAVRAMQRCDVLVALGARFDDRVTGKIDAFAPDATVIHIDVDAAEISKNRYADVPIVADLKLGLAALNPALRAYQAEHGTQDLAGWYTHLRYVAERYPMTYPVKEGVIAPQYVIERLGALCDADTVFCTGVGQHQMWAAQFLNHQRPRRFLTSGGLGTMGVAVPEAMGAKVACPDSTVWAIDGDGCFQMTNQELATCRIEGIPIKVALLNNSVLGMVHQWQDLFYGGRFSNTLLSDAGDNPVPDFCKLAEAYDCVAIRVTRPEDVDAAIEKANAITDKPVVVEFRVDPDAQVWPMVPAGHSNDDIIYAQGTKPVWGTEE